MILDVKLKHKFADVETISFCLAMCPLAFEKHCLIAKIFSITKYRVIPQKAEPVNFCITSANIKQIYSYFVDSNFCLCMIIPKSVSNLGRFAQKLWSLHNMSQMTSQHQVGTSFTGYESPDFYLWGI